MPRVAYLVRPLQRALLALLAFSTLLAFAPSVEARDSYVHGYFRKDGTYVAPHYRSAPDGNFYNNWSTRGNVNPYTGRVGTKDYPPPNYGHKVYVRGYTRSDGSYVRPYVRSAPDGNPYNNKSYRGSEMYESSVPDEDGTEDSVEEPDVSPLQDPEHVDWSATPVLALQAGLLLVGQDPGELDNASGPRTRRAFWRFARSKGMADQPVDVVLRALAIDVDDKEPLVATAIFKLAKVYER